LTVLSLYNNKFIQ